VSYEQSTTRRTARTIRTATNDNISRNWGVEGDTDDPAVVAMRYRLMRTFLATLAFSQGVPMIAHGDELARTQQATTTPMRRTTSSPGSTGARRPAEGARGVHAPAHRHPSAHPCCGAGISFAARSCGLGAQDVTWLGPNGKELTDADWRNPQAHALAC